MGSLVGFELRKILSRRVLQISLGVVLAMLCYVVLFNIASQHALDPRVYARELEGTAAIAQIKENAEALAGPITNEKATEALRAYQAFIGPDGEIKEEYRSDRSTPGADAAQYWAFNATHGAYMSLLLRPWTSGFQMPVSVAAAIDTAHPVDLYAQIRAKVASQLEDTGGTFTYTAAEKDFWLSKAERVFTPVEYGYGGGWEDFFGLAQYLVFALLAVVIACASVFNVEYQEKTDAVLLSTRCGKTRLGGAKVIAAAIVASGIYWSMALVLLAVPLAVFGADGAGLPIQSTMLANTYGVSLSAACAICCLIGYLAVLGLLGIVLALSARVRSSMGILAVGVAIVMVPLFVPNLHSSFANHGLYLLPYFALDPRNLFAMVSFAFGPLVIAYPVMLAILYGGLFVGGSVVAARSFSTHQVA